MAFQVAPAMPACGPASDREHHDRSRKACGAFAVGDDHARFDKSLGLPNIVVEIMRDGDGLALNHDLDT